MNILIAGYPYIKENYFNTFKFYPEKDRMFFILPKIWKAKDGKIIFHPPKESNVFTTKALFYHSHYPVVGGLWKGWMPSFPLLLLKLKINKKIDLVYSPSEPILLTTLYQGFWTKVFGLKHIIFSWENVPYQSKFHGINGLAKRLILRLNLMFCDGIICGNKKSLEILREFTTKPSAIIPLSGVDSDFYQPRHGQKIFKGRDLSGKIVFAFSGAIGYRKGIHLILEALKSVVAEIPDSHLLLVGSGEYEENIQKLIEELELRPFVTVIPWLGRNDLRNLLDVSDVFLYPSIPYGGWEEQFGYSMAEASLMELPVISTTSGSIEEVVENSKTGILIKPGDNEELKKAMIKLGKDGELRKKLGIAGRDYIMKNFSFPAIAQKFYDFFGKFK